MFSDVLISLRESNKMSQQELATKLGVSRSTIGMYEQGRREPSIETLEFIADIFNVDMDYLLGKSEVKRKIDLDYLREKYALEGILGEISSKGSDIDKEFFKTYAKLSDDQKKILLSVANQMTRE